MIKFFSKLLKCTEEETAWIFYDWANSSYATIAMVAILPTYFTTVCTQQGIYGDALWGMGTSIATFTTALLAPYLGAIGDYKGMKKKFFAFFLILGLVFTAFDIFVGGYKLLLVGYVLSYIGFMGSNIFYDSFLTDVTTDERMDKVSALGYSMGYIGGSTIPFVACIALILFGDKLGIDAIMQVKYSLAINVVWWAVFSIPMFTRVHQTHYLDVPRVGMLKGAIKNTFRTLKNIVSNKAIFLFMIAYFFYIDGVDSIINMATSFGTALGLDTTSLILAIMIIQLIAFVFTPLSVKASNKIGTLNTILIFVGIYAFITTLGFVMGYGIEYNLFGPEVGLKIFWSLACLVGTSQGGIQALSRSFFGKLIPPERSNEYFGFYDIFGKFAAVIGPTIYSIVKNLTGYSSWAILSFIILFVVGFVLLMIGKKYFRKNTHLR